MHDDPPNSRPLGVVQQLPIIEHPEGIPNLAPLNPKVKAAEAKIKRDDREHTVQLVTKIIATVVAALILLMAMGFTGWLIISPEAEGYAKHLAFAVWGGLVGGSVGYLFGSKAA